MKQTLLQMTADILSNLTSDEVNSISDTTESMQVATIIKQKYYDLIARGQPTKHTQLFQLTASGNSTEPVLMFMPDGVSKIDWLKYFDSNVNDGSSVSQYGFDHDLNTDIVSTTAWTTTSTTSNTIALGAHTFTVSAGLSTLANDNFIATSGVNQMIGTVTSYSGTTLVVNTTTIVGSGTYATWVIAQDPAASPAPGYRYVTLLPDKQFIDMINQFNPTDDNVQSFTFSDTSNSFNGNYTFYYKTDRQPQYATIVSNYYVIFDSYDTTQDTTLQASKTMAFGQVLPVFSMTDSYTPNLDADQFPLLLNEAKALAFYELKQMPHMKAEQEIKRGWSQFQRNKNIDGKPTAFNALPNFGRQPGGIW